MSDLVEEQEPVGELAVPEDLQFTTEKKTREGGQAGLIAFAVDGEVYYALRHRKTPEILANLTRAAARQAKLPDQIWAVMEFLDKVVEEESALRLRARYDDDSDEFGLEDLFAIMERLVAKLAPENGGNRGPQPARRRRR